MGMKMRMAWCGIFAMTIAAASAAAPPRVLVDGHQLELIATEPQIITPIGLAFDREGRLLVVESHTHQRQDDYPGPAGDRIRMLADTDGNGRLDRWSTFAEGFRHAMNVLVRADGGVYVVTRHNVELLRDTTGDGVADERQVLLRLETEMDYPHNGLSGIALLPDGSGLLLGLGENFGDWYRLAGSDGKAIEGQGGCGTVFQCGLKGDNLQRFARGFWNPFSICVDTRGHVFLVDNDPDASPPCRLLHVVSAGDYGFIWQYGRAGTHPLQAWDGQLPGTLPMAAGTGEAPTAILAHRGRLWVTSWGEHRIERYRLVPRGASFTAERDVVVQGDADFRPTGMAIGPDGSLYFGDWVRRDYEVHGHGRIWRLALPTEDNPEEFPPGSAPREDGEIEVALASDDHYIRTYAVEALAKRHDLGSHAAARSPHAKVRLGWLEAMRWADDADPLEILRMALTDDSADVRLYAVRWVADERIIALRDEVAALLEGPQPNERYYLAVLAAVDWLNGEPTMRSQGITDELLVRELQNPQRAPAAHALAIRLISSDHEFLTSDRLRNYLNSEYEPLRLEAVRTLAMKSHSQRFALLAEISMDTAQPESVRSEAIAGLAAAADENRDLLTKFASGSHGSSLQQEAERVLRLTSPEATQSELKPPAEDLAAWVELLNAPGNAESGRRMFFSAVGARCGVCHQHSGRGGRIGPDLTRIAHSSTRERIISSILQPSQEVAPHYQPWLLVTDDGKSHTGLRLPKGGDDGVEEYADSDGNQFSLSSERIELRQAAAASIMPEGLEKTVSIADLRDLVTFLTTPAEGL
jgi:putative membrane-bound dehydrogenase-like protein